MFTHLKKVWVAQQQLKIAEWDGTEAPQVGSASRPQRSGGNFRPQGGNVPVRAGAPVQRRQAAAQEARLLSTTRGPGNGAFFYGFL
ncbi:MAG: hypothetical protein PW735_06125 [Acidobacteriaceae bacterium]|nr:hypothetical protein [Acidobacteriaceae bacterium]